MQSAHDAPRCTAKSKRTGKRCRAPAVRGCRVCRMHGARGGAPTGEQNGNYRHGTTHKRGDPGSEVRQLAVALGTKILKKARWRAPSTKSRLGDAALALSDHSIKAARHATEYYLISRILDPTGPNTGACGIAPYDALVLRFRHTAIDACLVAVGAFYQTRRKPTSLPL